MVRISIVTGENEVLPVEEAIYPDLDNAVLELHSRGGDFFVQVSAEHPGVTIKEIRIILDEPIETLEYT